MGLHFYFADYHSFLMFSNGYKSAFLWLIEAFEITGITLPNQKEKKFSVNLRITPFRKVFRMKP